MRVRGWIRPPSVRLAWRLGSFSDADPPPPRAPIHSICHRSRRYTNGSCSESCYSGAELARTGAVVVVADLYSSTAMLTALVAETHEVPMVGYGCTSPALSNRVNFPFFSRVVAPDSYEAPYMAKMVRAIGWNHVAILHGSENYGKSFAASFASQCPAENITVVLTHEFVSFTSTQDQLRAPLERIRASGARVILLAATSVDAYAVIKAADALGLTGPSTGYTWLGPDGWMSLSHFQGAQADARNIMHGTLGLFPVTEPLSAAAILCEDLATSVRPVRCNRPPLNHH